jgi:aryl sulfotransferase
MTAVRRYEASMYDSNRWDGFELRPGDIIISTPPKCGTTWTQMICALLILQEPELPLPLDTLSPWIDMVTRARTDVFADLEAQTHRRFIKTHTPLDGIPNDPTVTYICVGRDPRDVGLSMDRHIDNTDIAAFLNQRERAAAIDGIELGPLRPPRPRPDSERDRFWKWVDDETPSTQVGSSLRRTVEHLQTFRDAADDLDVVYLHYDDLMADLEGQMRQMAARLGIDVDEHRWPRLVQAATFGSIPPRSSAAARAASGATSSTTPASLGTPRACGRSRPATSSSGCIASRSTEIPVRPYTRTTQADRPEFAHIGSVGCCASRGEALMPGRSSLGSTERPSSSTPA